MDRQIGLASLTIDTLPDGIRITERLDLTIPGAAEPERVVATADAELSPDLRLRRFTTVWTGTGQRLRAEGAVEGDSLLVLDLWHGAAAEPERVRMPVRGILTTPTAAPLRVAFGRGLRTGAALSVAAFDPLRLDIRNVDLRVLGDSVFIVADSAALDPVTSGWVPASLDTVPAWRLVEEDETGRVERWVDASGYAVAATTSEGLRLHRSAFEIVNGAYRDITRAGVRAPLERGLRPAGALLRAPAPRARVTVLADSGFDRIADAAFSGGLQAWVGDTLVSSTALGGVGDSSAPAARYLTAEPFVPAADPRIGAQARRIAGRQPRAEAAARLTAWVAENLELADAPLTALAAFDARRGTAAAQASLLVALARAAGIPARLAGGVVTTDGGWRRHTWAELYVDRWVPADPSFGRYPADAAYVRLAIGRAGLPLAVDPLASRFTSVRASR